MSELRRGRWSIGWERWEGKPRLGFFREYFDGWHYVFHAGPFWIERNP